MRVLVVEDQAELARLIARTLVMAGHRVDTVEDAETGAVHIRTQKYDVILIDIMLPGKSGLQLITEMRAEGRRVPIVVLSALDGVDNVVRALDTGADDYLTKPFQLAELMARIRAIERRGGSDHLDIIRHGPFVLERSSHVAIVNEVPLELTAKEYQLLEYFMLHPGEIARRTTLLQKVWGAGADPQSNVVDVHVGNLRRKLLERVNSPTIETIRGVGFRLQSWDLET